MSFPLNPVNGDKATVNGIKYIYASATRSWRRDFSNLLDRLFLVGGNQALANNTFTGDLVVYGGARIGKDLILNGNVYVVGTGTIFGIVSTSTNSRSLVGGATGSLVYQSSTSTTAFIPIATTGSILMSNGVIPIWTASAAITVAVSITATNIAGGFAGAIVYQSSPGTSTFSNNFLYDGSTLKILNTTQSTNTTTGALVVSGGLGVGGDVFIAGGLQVNGTTTFINSNNLNVTDKNITIAKGAINATAADGAGLTVEGPNVFPQIYYASANDSWNVNKLINLSSATIVGTEATNQITGALKVSGGIGVTGNIYASSFNGPVTGTIGSSTKNSGAFTTIVATSPVLAVGTNTGALVVQGGVAIGGNMTVGSLIQGTITNAQLATTATNASFATFSGTATTAVSAANATLAALATNVAGGSIYQIPYQTATSATGYSSNLTFDGTSFRTNKVTVSVSNASVLPTAYYGFDLINTTVNQSPALRLSGNSSGFAIVSSFGVLRVMQDATTLTNTLLSISPTVVSIPTTTVSAGSSSGALVVSGGVGVGGNLNVAGVTTVGGLNVTSIATATTLSVSGAATITGTLNSLGQVILSGSNTVPATASSIGTPGTIAWDSNYIYMCISTNTWKRTLLSLW